MSIDVRGLELALFAVIVFSAMIQEREKRIVRKIIKMITAGIMF